ncbi:MAG: hypothetical protein ACXVB1_00060 [Pseudobdellovibrionaceae bacterium]
MSEIDSKKIAQQKVEKALKLIDQASHLLSLACGELSPIIYADKQWKMVGDHYDATKDLARQVSFTIQRSKIDLDSDTKNALLKKAGEGI